MTDNLAATAATTAAATPTPRSSQLYRGTHVYGRCNPSNSGGGNSNTATTAPVVTFNDVVLQQDLDAALDLSTCDSGLSIIKTSAPEDGQESVIAFSVARMKPVLNEAVPAPYIPTTPLTFDSHNNTSSSSSLFATTNSSSEPSEPNFNSNSDSDSNSDSASASAQAPVSSSPLLLSSKGAQCFPLLFPRHAPARRLFAYAPPLRHSRPRAAALAAARRALAPRAQSLPHRRRTGAVTLAATVTGSAAACDKHSQSQSRLSSEHSTTASASLSASVSGTEPGEWFMRLRRAMALSRSEIVEEGQTQHGAFLDYFSANRADLVCSLDAIAPFVDMNEQQSLQQQLQQPTAVTASPALSLCGRAVSAVSALASSVATLASATATMLGLVPAPPTEPPQPYLCVFGVAPEWQRRGVGAFMLHLTCGATPTQQQQQQQKQQQK